MQDRNNNFNLLRLFAAALVVISHCFGAVGKGLSQPVVKIYGMMLIPSTIGLCIFFVISGYLIAQSMCNSSSALNYLAKRSLRIYPGLIVCHLVCIITLGLFFSSLPFEKYLQQKETWDYLLSNTLFYKRQLNLPGVFTQLTPHDINASIWTIQVEIGLYILLLVLWWLKMLKIKLLFVLFYILFLTGAFYCHDKTFRNWPIDNYFNYSLYFFTGVLLFLFSNHSMTRRWYLPFLLFPLLIINSFWLKQAGFMLALCYWVIYFARKKAIFPLRNIDLSYGIYVYAYPLQQCLLIILNDQINPWLLCLLNFIVSLPLAFASWKLVEKPFLKFKK